MEELHQINVVAGALEILLQKEEDARFQNEGVVDGDGTNAILAVPTGLTATGDRGIHHIVSNKEVGLQLKNETRRGARVSYTSTSEAQTGACDSLTNSTSQPKILAL